MSSRKERRATNRAIAKDARDVIVYHEQRLAALESAFQIVVEVLRDEGILTDERAQKAKERLLKSKGKVK